MKVAVLSDIHANIHALNAVYEDLERIGVEHILVAGDLVGYYYWPNEVVDKLSSDTRVVCIRGNHEDMLESCFASEAETERIIAKYGSGLEYCKNLLDQSMLDWLSALPRSIEIDIGNASFYLHHGSLGSTDTYLYPDSSPALLEANFSTCDFTIFGHTHYPFLHHRGKQIMMNPGSVGQPRDVGGMASFAIINLDNRTIQPRRVSFDVNAVIEAARNIDPALQYLWKIMER
jgi:putative phosphoesterase